MEHDLSPLVVCVDRFSTSLSFNSVKSSSEAIESLQRNPLSNLLEELTKSFTRLSITKELFLLCLKIHIGEGNGLGA